MAPKGLRPNCKRNLRQPRFTSNGPARLPAFPAGRRGLPLAEEGLGAAEIGRGEQLADGGLTS